MHSKTSVEEAPFNWTKGSQFIWGLVRPWKKFAIAAFLANLLAALFEGSTIGALAIALQALGNSASIQLAQTFGALGNWLSGIYASVGREQFFLGMVLFAILTQILRSAFQFAAEAATVHLKACVQAEAYSRIYTRILRLPFSKVSAYRLGDLTHSMNQADSLHETLGQLNDLARAALMILVYGVLLFLLSWKMTLVALAVYLGVSRLFRNVLTIVVRHAQSYMDIAVALSAKTTEYLQAIRLLHTFARQEQTIASVRKLTQQGIPNRRQSNLWSNSVEPITDTLTVVGAGVFLIGGYFILGTQGTSALPHLLTFLLALYRVTPRLRALYAGWAVLHGMAPNLQRMMEILALTEEPKDATSARPFTGFQEGLEFKQVSFRYHSGESLAVADLSFKVPRGNFTALVGISGAGKSTVADLLLRLFEPTHGQILVGGVPLSNFQRASWRAHVGVVSQESFLFHASIRENIAFGKPDATQEEILAAAHAAHADSFITRLSDGYDTVVRDRGYRLSGGQCQRIALARALIRQPDLLILDEATSSLDSESEQLIQQALDEQRGHRTIFTIAHRLSTIARADEILVLAEGRLVEQGTHSELIERGGIYARLWKLQSGGREQDLSWKPEAQQTVTEIAKEPSS